MRLFLYGTLIEESDTPMARWLAPKLRGCEPASVRGRLIAVRGRDGWFPALLPGPPGARVWGRVCEAALAPADLAWIDRYEGREYRRARVAARPLGAARRVAEAYRWRAPLPHGTKSVPEGDFLAWLAETGRRPFAIGRDVDER